MDIESALTQASKKRPSASVSSPNPSKKMKKNSNQSQGRERGGNSTPKTPQGNFNISIKSSNIEVSQKSPMMVQRGNRGRGLGGIERGRGGRGVGGMERGRGGRSWGGVERGRGGYDRGQGSFRYCGDFHRGRGGFRGRGGRGLGSMERGRGGRSWGGVERGRGGYDRGQGSFRYRGDFHRGRGVFLGRGGFDRGRGGFRGASSGFGRGRGGFDQALGVSLGGSGGKILVSKNVEKKHDVVLPDDNQNSLNKLSREEIIELLKQKTVHYENIKHLFEEVDKNSFQGKVKDLNGWTLTEVLQLLMNMHKAVQRRNRFAPFLWEQIQSPRKGAKELFEALMKQKKPDNLKEALDKVKMHVTLLLPRHLLQQVRHPNIPEGVAGYPYIIQDEFRKFTGVNPPIPQQYLPFALSSLGLLIVTKKSHEREREFYRTIGDIFIKNPDVFPLPHCGLY